MAKWIIEVTKEYEHMSEICMANPFTGEITSRIPWKETGRVGEKYVYPTKRAALTKIETIGSYGGNAILA